jgi:uncharacterized protein YybS (DUF2232 family)
LNSKGFILALGIVCAALITIAALYLLITEAFVEINPVAAAVAISVAVAGIAWFKKTASFHK